MHKLLLVVLLISLPICAQTVLKDTLQFKGSFNLSGSLTSGREFQRTFQFQFDPTLEKRSWSFENQFRFLFSDADNEVLNRNWDALSLLKLYFNGQKRWYPFFVTDLQTNLGYELEFRLGYGGGLTYKPTLKNNNGLLFSVATVYYRNRYSESIFVNSDRIGNQRNMLRFLLHYEGSTQLLKDKLVLKSNGWFLQSTRESADYIFKLYISLELKLTEVFSFTTDYRFNHENVSLASLDSNQQFTSIGIKANFK
ncbi:MAG: DUF481 domain-containing protein [Bacteroidota bacterium]|nr:DUF481 domain-containing protein [uncultured Allomuricauda sp.]